MNSKTIWILNHYALTPQQGGGTRHYSFAKELVNRGYCVYVFSSSRTHNTDENMLDEGEKSREELIDGIHWIRIQTRYYSGNGLDRIKSMLEFYHFMMKEYGRFNKPDVIIGSSVHPFACLAGIRISKKIGSKCISEIRDLWPQTLIDMGKLSKHNPLAIALYTLEKYIYKKSEKIIVTAPRMVDYIIGIGFSQSKVVNINNGVDIAKYRTNLLNNDSVVDDIVNGNGDSFKCTYAGAIGEANYLDNLVQAAEILQNEGYKNIKMIIIGDGSEKNRLIKLAESNNLQNISFYNPIKKDSIPLLLSKSDVNIFNLKRIDILKYGLSANKLFDYMCSGKPIVFACETSSDYVKESGCGISIPPENPKEMADAIVKIYNMSNEEREAIGKFGKEFVEQNFDIVKLVDRLEEVISK